MTFRADPMFLALVVVIVAVGCRREEPPEAVADYADQGRALAQRLVLVDTHVDLPYRLKNSGSSEDDASSIDISTRTEDGDFDFVRAQQGGLDAPFMSIYVPAEHQASGDAAMVANTLIDLVEGFETRWPDKFQIAKSPDELLAIVAEGRLALPLGMENGAPIGDDLANLRHFYERGIRYITLTHSRNNQICDSSYDPERRWNGLSPFGVELIREMNRLGVMIDISHVSDATFDQVLELSVSPVIASHSSCRVFTPGWERNLSDDQIKRLAAAGGVVHINFGSPFLTRAAYEYAVGMFRAQAQFVAERGLDIADPRAKAFEKEYQEKHPLVLAELADVVAHIDHVVQLVGVDHVGFGSDFDGVGDLTPVGLEDVSKYPALLAALLEKGYTEDEIAKIASGNVLRVWAENERIAEQWTADSGS